MWKRLFETPWPDQYDLPTAVRQQALDRIRGYWRWLIVPLIVSEVLLWAVARPQGVPSPNAYIVPPLLLSAAFLLGQLPRLEAVWLVGMVALFALHGMLIKGLGGVTAISFILPYTFASLTMAGRRRVWVQACCVVGFWFSLFYEIVATPGLNPPRYFLVSYNILLATMIFQGLRFLSRLGIELNSAHVAGEVTQRSQQFLARVSHELRTPLNSVLGFAKLLRRGQNFTDAQRGYVQQVVEEGEQLNQLVSDLLDSAHLATGKLTLLMAPVQVNEVCAAVANEFRALVKPAVTFRVELTPTLPPVIGDALRLRQVVRNLVANAVKYTPSGVITLRSSQHGSMVHLSVQDTGPGVPDEQRELVFVPFVKLDNRSAGVGLGLDIAQQLARLHGGVIHLQSVVGEGSTFTVELPAAPPLSR
jgi:signal transduction histidine kinase